MRPDTNVAGDDRGPVNLFGVDLSSTDRQVWLTTTCLKPLDSSHASSLHVFFTQQRISPAHVDCDMTVVGDRLHDDQLSTAALSLDAVSTHRQIAI